MALDSSDSATYRLAGPGRELASLASHLANQRWVEERLLESEERYRIVADTALDAIVTVNEDGIILFVNQSAERIFGYSTPEILEQNLELLLPGYSYGRDGGAQQTQEILGKHKDGRSISLEVSFGEFVEGSKRLVTGVLRDISRRKQAEEEVRRVNDTLRALIEATPLAIVALDAEEKVSKWNSAAEKMFGWSEAEVLGKPLPLAEVDAHGEPLAVLLAARRSGSFTAETVRETKAGVSRDISMSAAPLAGPNGAPAGAVAVITDITDRKRMEGQLRQAQKMEAVGRLAGGVAHDFNNLLTVITGFGELLLGGLAPDSKGRTYALEIQKSAEKAMALTKQLLAFSRHQVTHPILLDINPVVSTMTNMLRRLIGDDVELAVSLDPSVGKIKADPSQVEQIIVNLVVNARDAVQRGGWIAIETHAAELGADYAHTHFPVKPGSFVFLAVTDNGAGMTQNTKSHLFEPFFTTKEEGKGTGLGLSTIYGIVKEIGGDICVTSEVGKGTTIKVYLPVADRAPAGPPGDGLFLRRGNETILLVDDEPAIRELTQQVLERAGYTVLPAANADEAIRIWSIHPGHVHLLLTDMELPATHGRELAARLRPLRRNARVLYMSGHPAETMAQNGAIERDTAFLEKPFTAETLARKVRETLDQNS